jgi:hypothetical protein
MISGKQNTEGGRVARHTAETSVLLRRKDLYGIDRGFTCDLYVLDLRAYRKGETSGALVGREHRREHLLVS